MVRAVVKRGRVVVSKNSSSDELSEIDKKIAEKKAEVSNLSSRLVQLREDCDRWTLAKKESYNDFLKEKKGLETEVALAERKIAGLESRIKELEAEKKRKENEINVLDLGVSSKQKEMAILLKSIEEKGKEAKTLSVSVGELSLKRKELAEILNKITEAESRLVSLTNKITTAKKRLDDYKKTYQRWGARVSELRSWANNLARKENELIKMAVSLGVYSPTWRKKLKVVGNSNKNNGEKKKKSLGGNETKNIKSP